MQAHIITPTDKFALRVYCAKWGECRISAIYEDVFISAMIEKLIEVSTDLGISDHNLPSMEGYGRIAEKIKENHGRLFFHEIALAFEMAMSGELDVDMSDFRFQKFAWLNISMVIQAYLTKKPIMFQRVRDLLPKPESSKPTPEQISKEDQRLRFMAVEAFAEFCIGEITMEYAYPEIFQLCEQAGVHTMALPEKHKLFHQAQAWVKEQAAQQAAISMQPIAVVMKDMPVDAKTKRRARLLACRQMFGEMQEMGFDLKRALGL